MSQEKNSQLDLAKSSDSIPQRRTRFSTLISRPWLIASLIFVVITVTLGIAGQGLAFVREDIMMLRLFTTYDMNLAQIFTDGWTGLYGNDFPWIDWAYRPLEMLLDWGLVHFFGTSEFLQILFKSAIIGLAGVLIYLLMLEFTRRHFLAIASAFLSIFTVSMVIEGWWYHHIIGYTEVAILFGFLAYSRYRKYKQLRWLTALWFTSLAAPLLGEYGISLPIIVLLSLITELVIDKTRLDWKLLVSLIILVFLGFYPNFLPNLLIEQRIVFTSILDRFFGATAAEQGVLGWVQPSLVYFLIIGSLTPLLTGMALLAMTIHFFRNADELPNWLVMGQVLLYILLTILIRNYPPPLEAYPFDPYYLLPNLFPALFAILSYRLNRFVAIWFLVSYLPFIRIPHLAINLIPAMIPWTLLLVLWISTLVDEVKLVELKNLFKTSAPIKGAISALAVVLVLVVGVAAQMSNVIIARETWGKSANNARQMGEYAAKNFPTGSIILGEQLSRFEVLDMSYYSQGKVQGNLVVYEDVWWPLKQIKAEELSQFLQDDSNYTEKYYLIQENIRGALFRSTQVSPEDFELVTRFNVHSRIILIDPFYLMVPRDLPYFWGTMDISYFLGLNVIKIYPVGAGPFHSEFSGWYSIYKYTGKTAEGVKQAIDDYLEE